MDCDVTSLILEGRWSEARLQYLEDGTDYYEDADAPQLGEQRQLSVKDVVEGRSGNYKYVVATLLHVKMGRQTFNTNKTKKAERPYDRFFMFREVRGGELFALVSQHPSESRIMMSALNFPFLGTNFMLLDVTFSQLYFTNLPRFHLKFPLIPIDTDLVESPLQKFVPERLLSARYWPLFGRVMDLSISNVAIVGACGAIACDASHISDRKMCFALDIPARPARSISVTLSTQELNIVGAELTSRSFGKSFMTDAYFQSSSQPPKLLALRKAINRQLNRYRQAKVPWIIVGWTKAAPTQSANEAVGKGSLIHIVHVRPARLLVDVPVFDVATPVNVPDMPLGRVLVDRYERDVIPGVPGAAPRPEGAAVPGDAPRPEGAHRQDAMDHLNVQANVDITPPVERRPHVANVDIPPPVERRSNVDMACQSVLGSVVSASDSLPEIVARRRRHDGDIASTELAKKTRSK